MQDACQIRDLARRAPAGSGGSPSPARPRRVASTCGSRCM